MIFNKKENKLTEKPTICHTVFVKLMTFDIFDH